MRSSALQHILPQPSADLPHILHSLITHGHGRTGQTGQSPLSVYLISTKFLNFRIGNPEKMTGESQRVRIRIFFNLPITSRDGWIGRQTRSQPSFYFQSSCRSPDRRGGVGRGEERRRTARDPGGSTTGSWSSFQPRHATSRFEVARIEGAVPCECVINPTTNGFVCKICGWFSTGLFSLLSCEMCGGGCVLSFVIPHHLKDMEDD